MVKKLLLISPFVLLLIFSCNDSGNLTKSDEITISGKVNGYNEKNAELYLIYSQPGSKRYNEPLEVDPAGNFSFKLKSNIPLDAYILDRKSLANINFIYHPGDSIYVEFSPKKHNLEVLKTVLFKGDRQQTNNLLIDFQVLREKNNLGYGAIQGTPNNEDVKSFLLKMDSIKLKQHELIKLFKSKNRLDAETERWINSFAYQTYYHFLDNYDDGHVKNLPNDYYNYNDDLPKITKSDIVSWENLKERIRHYSRNKVGPDIRSKFSNIAENKVDVKINIDSLIIKFIRDYTNNDLLNQLLISNYYTSQFNQKIVKGYENNQDLINTIVKVPIIKENLNNYYKETLALINKPEIYTNEVLLRMKDTPIEKTFSKILSENKGKVIYIDIWATWCGPCIKAMPDSKKLMEKLKEKNVSFVYICIESKEYLWKRFVSEFDLGGGQHYLMDTNQSEFFRTTMDVQGIPEYFIIDKLGNIVDRGNHLFPGNKITEEKILSSLKRL